MTQPRKPAPLPQVQAIRERLSDDRHEGKSK